MITPSQIPTELVKEFARGNGALFVGAGLSMGAGLPSWEGLVNPLRDQLKGIPHGNHTPTQIACWYDIQKGRHALISHLRDKLPRRHVKPTPCHHLLVNLPVERIFTTNFDDLLEKAFDETDQDYTKVVKDTDLPHSDTGLKQLVKVHGDLLQPDSIIITKQDYFNYLAQKPFIADTVKHALLSRTVLFLGYSFSDQNLGMILSQIGMAMGPLRRRLYAVQIDPSSAVIEELEEDGLNVISLQRQAGEDGTSRAVHTWLEAFRKEVERSSSSARVHFSQMRNHNLPERVRYFSGRGNELWDVIKGLKSPSGTVSIEGFPGVGKTALAIEVGRRCSLEQNAVFDSRYAVFAYVVWVKPLQDAPDANPFDVILNTIADTMKFGVITQIDASDIEKKKSQVQELLGMFKTLVIIDGAESFDTPDVELWLQNVPQPSKVLVTTRQKPRYKNNHSVALNGLPESEAMTFLQQQIRENKAAHTINEKHLPDLIKDTRGNPMAMQLALRHMHASDSAFEPPLSFFESRDPVEAVNKASTEVLEKSWAQLSNDGKHILLAASMFSNESSILGEALCIVSGIAQSGEFSKALNECRGFYLISPDPVSELLPYSGIRYAFHPMTLTFAREKLELDLHFAQAARLHFIEYFRMWVKKMVVRERPKEPYWNALVHRRMSSIDPEWPNIQKAVQWAIGQQHDEATIDFVMLLVHYMDSRLHNAERLSFVNEAIAAFQRLGRKEEEALLRIDALGWTYVEESQFENAEREIRVGLTLIKNIASGSLHNLQALGLAWLARVLIEQSTTSEADRLMKTPQAESNIKNAMGITGCSDWIRYRVLMAAGDIRLKKNEYSDALQFYKKCLSLADKYGGEEGYQILPRIGLAYLGIGKLDEARSKFEELLELSMFDHIQIGLLYARYGLAMVASQTGTEALDHAEEQIESIKAHLSRWTSTHLLLELINQFHNNPHIMQRRHDMQRAGRQGQTLH